MSDDDDLLTPVEIPPAGIRSGRWRVDQMVAGSQDAAVVELPGLFGQSNVTVTVHAASQVDFETCCDTASVGDPAAVGRLVQVLTRWLGTMLCLCNHSFTEHRPRGACGGLDSYEQPCACPSFEDARTT